MNPRDILRRMRQHLADTGNGAKEHQLRLVSGALRQELRRLAATRPGTWTAASRGAAVVQLRAAIVQLTTDMGDTLRGDLSLATRRSHRDAVDFLVAADKAYTGAVRPLRFEASMFLDERARHAGQARIAHFSRSLAAYGVDLTRAVETAAAQTALLGQPYHRAVDIVGAQLRQQAGLRDWQIRRLVETEVSAAYNQMQLDALLAEDDPSDPMHKQLLAVFDSRTGRDSVLLHGQKRPVREPFYDSYLGRFFMAPPNRPHDRELMHGVRPSWQVFDLGVEDAADHAPAARPAEIAAHPDIAPARPPVAARRGPVPQAPGQGRRFARNLRTGDVLARAGRPRVATVVERGDRVTVETDNGTALYFAAGAAIGVLLSS